MAMKILALEFSSEQRSVAVGETSDSGVNVLASASGLGGRSTRAFALIDEALREAGVRRREIGRLAIGRGPGSYSGIRAAIAIGQGWQLAFETKLAGVSSVAALAAQLQAEGMRGRCSIIVDAQRNECYAASYEFTSFGASEVRSLCIVPASELRREFEGGGTVVGPEAARLLPGARTVYPAASWVARLAVQMPASPRGEEIEPLYLRETKFVKAPPLRSGGH
jgi:tRNA threonylcarbamoyl adenosine modification protein YeaZ